MNDGVVCAASRHAGRYRAGAVNGHGDDDGEVMSSEWCGQHAADAVDNDSSYESSYSVLSDSDVSCDNVMSASSCRRFTATQCM